jgi:hypothetical protein
MARFKSHAEDYWKLPDFSAHTEVKLVQMLQDRDYQAKQSSSKAELLEHKARVDKSLPCYATCTKQELHAFAVDRRLPRPTRKGCPSQVSLARTLFEADETRMFPRFLDLAAELRNRIYFYYVEGFTYNPDTAHPPPLALTCKQIWKEVVPVFYEHSIFDLTFAETTHAYGAIEDVFGATNQTWRFGLALKALSPLPHLQRFRIRVCSGISFKPAGIPQA